MITDSAERLFKSKTEAVKAVAEFMDTIEYEYNTLPERCKEVTEEVIKIE